MKLLSILFLASSVLALSPPLCPTCDPLPTGNKCDITTSCIRTNPSGLYECACRAGYKAAAKDYDINTHWRVKWTGQEYRVFVKPGVKCDTLCKEWWLGPESCKEVKVRRECNV